MSITDELRNWWVRKFPVMDKELHKDFTAIADRIDAEHEEVVRKRQRSCVYYDPERHYCSCHDYDVSGYVELPKDADGEYIHVGDRLDGYGKTIEVVELRHGRSGWVLISRDGNGYADTFAFTHHAPTVEDVLREFAGTLASADNNWGSDVNDAIAKYAAKLSLAKGEDA